MDEAACNLSNKREVELVSEIDLYPDSFSLGTWGRKSYGAHRLRGSEGRKPLIFNPNHDSKLSLSVRLDA